MNKDTITFNCNNCGDSLVLEENGIKNEVLLDPHKIGTITRTRPLTKATCNSCGKVITDYFGFNF